MRRRLLAVVGGVAVAVASVLAVGSAPVSASDANRVSGADRYATAVEVARRVAGGALSRLDRIIVVTGENFPDALAASGLAGFFDRCPSGVGVCGRTAILLSRTDSLPTVTRNAIRSSRLPASRVIVVGGVSAVAARVHDQIAAATGWDETGRNPVTRLAGETRYETAAAIVDYVRQRGGASLPDSYRTVLVANGENFPDALAAGSIAYANGHLLVLSRAPVAPAVTVEAVENLRANCAILIGGNVALSRRVSTQVNTALTLGGCGVDRIGGADRYETAANIATRFVALNGPGTSVMLASGATFADALTMGPLSRSDTPMILTAPEGLSPAAQNWLRDNPSNAANIDVIGGPDAVPPSVVNDAVGAAPAPQPSPAPPPPPPPPPGISFWPNSVTSQGGGAGMTITATSATASGESFVTGTFSDTARFAGATTGSALTSAGDSDVFVGKLDASGAWDWVARAGGSERDEATSVAFLADGSAIVTGVFRGAATFGSVNLTTTTGARTVFVAKISATGTWLWAAKVGRQDAPAEIVFSVAVDATGSAFIAGIKAPTSDTNPLILTHATGGGNLSYGEGDWDGGRDPFVAKIDTDGTWEWASVMKTTDDGADARGISVLADGSAIVTGFYRGSATLSAANGSPLTSAGDRDAFVARIDGSGVWQWAASAGGTGEDRAYSVSVLPDGSGAIVTGSFTGTATFSGQTPITSDGGTDAFVAGIDANGAWQWAVGAGGAGNDEASGVSVLADGSGAVVTGSFTGTATFTGATTGSALTSTGGTDVFVASVNESGAWQWAASAGGAGNDDGAGVSVLPDGSAILSGSLVGATSFGDESVAGLGNSGGFVAQVGPTGTFTWATGATAQSNELGAGITGTGTATLADGSAFVVGVLNQTATFSNTSYGMPITVSSVGGQDVYVAKLDADGRYEWVTLASGPGNDAPTGVSTLADGSAIVVGAFRSTVSFPGAATGSVLTSVGDSDIFVAKISASGEWQWAVPAGDTGDQQVTGVAAFPDGSGAMVTGYSATVGATPAPITFAANTTVSNAAITFSNNWGVDGFVARVNGSGLWEWARPIGNDTSTSDSVSRGTGISLIVDGGAVVGAVVTGEFNYGTSFAGISLTSGGGLDAFVARIDANGAWEWAHKAGAEGDQRATGLTAVSTTSAYVVGTNAANATLSVVAASTVNGTTPISLVNGDGVDVFVARINLADGKWHWAKVLYAQAGASDYDMSVSGVATSTNGSAIVTGTFAGTANISGLPSLVSAGGNDMFVAKIDADGTWLWAQGAGGTGDDSGASVATFADGSAVLTGNYVGTANFGDYGLNGLGNPGTFVAKIDADGGFVGSEPGSLDPGFNLDVTGTVRSVAVQSDGKVIVGGDFVLVDGGTTHHGVVRLNADGTVDATFRSAFSSAANYRIFAVAAQSDGKVLVGGNFTLVGGLAYGSLIRLNADGTVDQTFTNPNTVGGEVLALAVQSDGKILVGGSFTQIGGQPRNRIARLGVDGTVESFNPNADGTVKAIVVQADGKVVFAGQFSNVNGSNRRLVTRVNADGTADSDLTVNPTIAGTAVNAVAVQADGKMVIGGEFTQISGQTRRGVARLNVDGSHDFTFGNPNVSQAIVNSLYVRSDGKIVIGGAFGAVDFQTRSGVARLNANGSLDTAFPNPDVRTFPSNAFSREVYAVVPQRPGRIVIGGRIGAVQGQLRSGVALLNG